jgi:hypothetical protein
MESTDINNFIKKIHNLNTKINNNNYINRISSHRENFVELNRIIKKYQEIHDVFKENLEDNYYLFKCFYDIFIKYLVNIINFIEYLKDIINTSKSSKSILKSDIDNVNKTYGTIYNYTFVKLLKFLKLKESKKYITIKDLYLIIQSYDKKEGIKKIPDLHKLEFKKFLNKKNINTLIKNLEIIINNTIADIVDLDQTIKKKTKHLNYITIPQYNPICWFASILTGMCYSDLNKKLIYDKITKNDSKFNPFSEMIKFLIKEITNQYKTYDEKDSFYCEMLNYLKNEPVQVLNYFIDLNLDNFLKEIYDTFKVKINLEDMSNEDYDNMMAYLNENYLYSKYSYFMNFIYYNLKKNEDGTRCSFNLDDSKVYEISYADSSILVYFYDLINVFCKYVYLDIDSKSKAYNYYENALLNDENSDKIPDIIAIEYNNKIINLNDENKIKKVDEEIKIEDSEMGIIIYKDHKYKLDYILHFNDTKIKCDLNSSCVHCISAITYGGVEYIYDSDKIRKIVDCEETYKIPCSLIKQKWSKNMNKELSYCTTDCNYNIDCKLDKIYRDDICYTYNFNLIYVYIKID